MKILNLIVQFSITRHNDIYIKIGFKQVALVKFEFYTVYLTLHVNPDITIVGSRKLQQPFRKTTSMTLFNSWTAIPFCVLFVNWKQLEDTTPLHISKQSIWRSAIIDAPFVVLLSTGKHIVQNTRKIAKRNDHTTHVWHVTTIITISHLTISIIPLLYRNKVIQRVI